MKLNKKASRLFLICLALYLGLSFLAGLIARMISAEGEESLYLLSAAVSIAAFLIPALIFRRKYALPRFKAPRIGQIIIALILGVGTIYLNEALSYLNNAIFFNVEVTSNSTTPETILGLSLPTMLIALAIVPPISEEFIMRGTLLEVWRRYSPVGAAFLTSLLFALLHIAPSSLIIYMGIGLILAVIYIITRNVWLTVIVHFVNNIFSVLAALLIKSQGGLEALQQSEEAAEAGALDISALANTQSGLIMLFFYSIIIAAIIIVPMLLLLRSSCRRRKMGMYAEEESTEPEEPAEEAVFAPEEPSEGFEEKGSMWNDGLLWATLIILTVLNIVMGLTEFGIIKLS